MCLELVKGIYKIVELSSGLLGDTADEALLFCCDPWMDDLLELSKLSTVVEDNFPKRRTVDEPVSIQDPIAKDLHDLAPCGLARSNDVAGEVVGINDDRAAALEHLSHGAFP